MPRKPKPRKIENTSDETMKYAVNLVCNENLSLRVASDRCNIKFQKKRDKPNAVMEPNYWYRQIFKSEPERMFTAYLMTCNKMA